MSCLALEKQRPEGVLRGKGMKNRLNQEAGKGEERDLILNLQRFWEYPTWGNMGKRLGDETPLALLQLCTMAVNGFQVTSSHVCWWCQITWELTGALRRLCSNARVACTFIPYPVGPTATLSGLDRCCKAHAPDLSSSSRMKVKTASPHPSCNPRSGNLPEER